MRRAVYIAADAAKSMKDAAGGFSLLQLGLGRLLNGMTKVVGLARRIGRLPRLMMIRMEKAAVRFMTLEPSARAPQNDGAFNRPRDPQPSTAQEVQPATPETIALVTEVLAATPDKGDLPLPDDLNKLALLLGDPPPTNDFLASDLIRECFQAMGGGGLRSRALLAVAINLGRQFGQPRHLPLATTRAWRMLDAPCYQDEMAVQLEAIAQFISDWQRNQQTFLCLDHGEIELIEYLFEGVHPGRHAKAMTEVLNFKVLSNRRQGLLRRIPHRVRKMAGEAGGPSPDVLATVLAMRDFLAEVAQARHYAPIVQAAQTSLEEVDKLLERIKPPPALPGLPPGAMPATDAQALARITPVKMPASELADQAIRSAQGQPPQPPPPQQQQPAQALPAAPRPPATPPPAAALAPAALPQAISASPAAGGSIPPADFAKPGGALVPVKPGLKGGNHLAVESVPRVSPRRFSVTAQAQPQMPVGVEARKLGPGAGRAPLPTVAMGPLPVLAQTVAAPLSLAAPEAPPPQGMVLQQAPESSGATGRIVIGPPRPAAPRPAQTATGSAVAVVKPPAPVTDLTVVPRKKRAPITQAVKRQTVMKVLRGEPSASLAASLGIRESKVDEWVDAFISAGAGALVPAGKPRKAKAAKPASEELSAEFLRAKLAEVLAAAQMIERAMEAQLQAPRRPVLLAPPPDHTPKRPHKRKG